MRTCGPDCYPICDFCSYYKFNGDEKGRYVEKGWCSLHERRQDPSDGCDDFWCFMLKEQECGKC